MGMTHNFQRPSLPYTNESLQNDNRYRLLTRSNNRPATDLMIDTDFNYVIDGMRQLDTDIGNINAGILTGADDPNNAGFLPTTDGAGNISWILISDQNVQDTSLSGSKFIPGTIGEIQLGDGSIPDTKLAPNAVTTIKILDQNITEPKMADNSVSTRVIQNGAITEPKMADNSVSTRVIQDNAITTSKILNGNVTLAKLSPDALNFMNALVPIGLSIQWPGNQPPTNIPGVVVWMEANGQQISRATYSSLFALLGTTYGSGDGATTFNLPDMRGYATVGIGSDNSTGGRITNATAPAIGLGKAFGNETHTLDVTQIPPHDHLIGNHWGVDFGTNITVIGKFGGADLSGQTGGGLPHNNVQPSIFMRYYIRAL